MSTYERFAHIYDQMGSDEFSIRMFKYSLQLLRKLKYRPRSILDIACGTGSAAALWADQNMKVYGIDGSAHMLEMAKEKARSENLDINLSQQPLTSFSISKKVDLVTCYFDSINYLLTLKDVTDCFKCVRKSLYPGGYFIFDSNTPEAMKILWDSQTYAEVKDEIAWVWKNMYFPKAKRAEVQATFFTRRGENWERFDEIHTERGYTLTELRKCLKAAGLKPVKEFQCLKYKKPDRSTLRVAVIAKAPD